MPVMQLVSEDKIDARTKEVRWTDMRVASWLCATQHWTWEGGDAIAVVTGRHPNVTSYVVIRTGDKVQVFEANSVRSAMAWAGLIPEDYTV